MHRLRTEIRRAAHAGRTAGLIAVLGVAAVLTGCGGASHRRQPTTATGGGTESSAAAAATRLQAARFTAHYRGTSPPPQEFSDATLTLYQDAQRSRIDVGLVGTKGALAFSEIVNGSAHYLCFKDRSIIFGLSGGELAALPTPPDGGGTPACVAGPGAGASFILDVGTIAKALNHGDLLPTAPRTIAGTVGDCYAGTDAESSAPEEVCVSRGGILLYLSTGGAQQDEIRATSIETTVDDTVFTLPYPLIGASPAGAQ